MEGIAVPGRMETIRRQRAQGGLVAAVFPIHYSRALLRAFDILPVEVWGPPGVKENHGAVHLQPYVCSIVRNALSFLESGGLEIADMLLVPHACDSLQGLGSLLKDFVRPRQPVLTLYIPRGQRLSDVAFLADELRSIFNSLQALTGRTPSVQSLLQASIEEEAADEALAAAHYSRQSLPLTDEGFYRLIRSREYLPSEEFTLLTQEVLGRASAHHNNAIPILLSGIVPEPMSLFAALREMGARVAADDLACCGRRLYPPGKSTDPFQRMAERIIEAPPDPTRGSPIQDRLGHLLRLAQSSGARGIVFYPVKFCEPELFDQPQLREGLRQAGLPSLVIEIDLNDELPQPMLNRLEAFIEMLS